MPKDDNGDSRKAAVAVQPAASNLSNQSAKGEEVQIVIHPDGHPEPERGRSIGNCARETAAPTSVSPPSDAPMR
jgi:hypothetical protein